MFAEEDFDAIRSAVIYANDKTPLTEAHIEKLNNISRKINIFLNIKNQITQNKDNITVLQNRLFGS